MSPSTFSYAQAAKGLGSSNPSASSSRVASGAITPTKSSTGSPVVEPQAKPNIRPADNLDQSKQKEQEHDSTTQQLPSSADLTSQKHKTDSTGSISPPSMALIESSTSTLHREDDISSLQNASSESTWENVSQSSNMIEKSADLSDRTVTEQGKESKDDWVRVPKASQEAPVPPVNVWKQRMDAASAKVPAKRNTNTAVTNIPTPKSADSAGKAVKSPEARIKDSKPQDEDPKSRRATSRRPDDKAEVAPPSMRDETSWPTPEIAQGEKFDTVKKPAEKAEVPKPSGKKTEWKKVEVQHSVVWNTPLPNQQTRRGGRSGGRGGRGASSSRTSPPGTRVNGSHPDAASAQGDATKGENGHRSASPTRPRRVVSEETPRRESKTASSTKDLVSKEAPSADKRPQSRPAPQEDRTSASAPAHGTFPRHNSSHRGGRKQDASVEMEKRKDIRPQHASNGHVTSSEIEGNIAHPPAAAADEERKPQAESSTTRFPPRNGHGHPNTRRASLRGRNGYHGYQQHHSPNPAHSGFQSPYGARSPSTPHDAFWSPPQHGGRSFRPPRTQSVTSDAYARYPNGFPSAGVLPPLNTFIGQQQMYDWQAQAMSAMPYTPMMEQYSMFGTIHIQMEYYFSVNNLCHDMYLRQHMDSQGFVLLSVVANFNRVKNLTQDLDLLKYVCQHSISLEHRLGVDGKDRIRKSEGWEKWVLEKSQRDAAAQHDGVELVAITPSNQSAMADQQLFNGVRHPSLPQPLSSPLSMPMNGQAYPGYFRDNAREHQNASPFRGSPAPLKQGYPTGGPVSSVANTNTSKNVANAPSEYQRDGISNAEVEDLVLMTRPNAAGSNDPSLATRTLSNGSMDDRSMGKPDNLGIIANGASSHENDAVKPPSLHDPFLEPASSEWSQNQNQDQNQNQKKSKLYWAKDGGASANEANTATCEKYVDIRANALEQRRLAAEYPYDMVVLYQFWSHFLVGNFNTRMYEEFRELAEEDAEKRGNNVGTQNLVHYYSNALLHQNSIRDVVLDDVILLAQKEGAKQETSRMAFDTLRGAWRNGALNLQTRKKICDRLDSTLRKELDA